MDTAPPASTVENFSSVNMINQTDSAVAQALNPSGVRIDENPFDDEWTVKRMPNRETVTLQLPSQFFSSSIPYTKELEHSVIKRTTAQCNSTTYPLPLYHSHTWCYGVYTPLEPEVVAIEDDQFDDPLATNKGQPLVHDWTSFRQPTFLVSRPLRVYTRREVITSERSNQSKAVLKLTDIRNMKAHNGKIHVTLNGQPLVQQTLPQLFHGGGDYYDDRPLDSFQQQSRLSGRRSNSVTNASESDDDKIDLALAKHFLQEEVRVKQKLQMRIRMFSERLAQ